MECFGGFFYKACVLILKGNLTHQMKHFPNLLVLYHVCIWKRAYRKPLSERPTQNKLGR